MFHLSFSATYTATTVFVSERTVLYVQVEVEAKQILLPGTFKQLEENNLGIQIYTENWSVILHMKTRPKLFIIICTSS